MTTAQIDVETYVPFPRQAQFHSSPAKYRMFGGAAGPGKSRSLLEEAVAQALEVDCSDCLILRRTYGELEKSMIEPLRRFILPLYEPYGAKFNEAEKIFRLPNGSNVYFGYCKREQDVYQYQGAEFLFIGIDELTMFSLKMWKFLTSRNRCSVPFYTAGPRKGKPVKATMAGATNPGNIGHKWVKSLWIDKKPAVGMEADAEYDPKDYDFIKATIEDNPIYANDKEYRRTLEALPLHQRQAFLNGDWNVYAGQYFDVFDTAKNVERHTQLEPWYPRWISIDWGYEHPSDVQWHAEDEIHRIHTYRQLNKNHQTPRMLAHEIVELTKGEKIDAIYLSPDAFAKRTDESTIALQLNDIFQKEGLPAPSMADNDRVGGWMLMYELLRDGMWMINTNCANLIETLPMMTRDPNKIEDCLKFDGDDACDNSRYGCKTRLGNNHIPKPIEIERKVEAMHLPNLTQKAIWTNVVANRMEKEFKPFRMGRRGRR